jgi:hypothetical protein
MIHRRDALRLVFGLPFSGWAYLDGPEFAQFLIGDMDRLLTVVRRIGLS